MQTPPSEPNLTLNTAQVSLPNTITLRVWALTQEFCRGHKQSVQKTRGLKEKDNKMCPWLAGDLWASRTGWMASLVRTVKLM